MEFLYTKRIIDTVREPLLALDHELRVVSASRSFYKQFQLSREETENRLVYEIGNGQWDTPELRGLFETIISGQESIEDFKIKSRFEMPGEKVLMLNARRLDPEEADGALILLAIEDVTGERNAESLIRESERKFQNEHDFVTAVLQTSGALILVIERDGKITRYNKACEELTGYTADEVIGRSVFDLFIPPEEREDVLEIAARLFAGETVVDSENHWMTRSGQKRFIRWRNSILFDDKGMPVYAIATGIDITERKEAETALRKSEEQLRDERNLLQQMVNNLPYAFVLYSPDLRLEYTNEIVLNRYGLTLDQIVGKTVPEIFSEEISGIFVPLLQRVRDTGEPFSGEVSYHAGGKLVTNIPSIAPLFNEKKEINHLIILSVDITERKRIESELRESEVRFRNMFESHDAVMLIIDPSSGEILDANISAGKFYGYTREELRQLNIHNINQLSPEKVKEEMQRAQANERSHFIFPHRLADGSFRTVEVYSTPFRIENRTLLFSVIHDISERIAAEEALRGSEKKYRAVFEQAAVGIGRVSFQDARWIDVNSAFCMMLGYSHKEMKATPWPHITHPDDVDLDWIPFRQMAEGDLDSYTVEKRFIHKRGHHIWARLTLSLVRDKQGRPDYEIAIVEDINSRKQAEEALLKTQAELQDKVKEQQKVSELLENLLYITAHDLKNPIANMQLALEIAGKTDNPGNKMQIIGTFDQLVNKMDNTIKGITRILQVQKVDASTASEVHFVHVVGEILQDQKEHMQLCNGSLQTDFSAKKSVIYIDAFLFSIMNNLINNAIKYCRQEVPLRIDISSRQEKGYTVLTVKDNGIGIDLEKYSGQLFVPFRRIEAKDTEGTGLGLYIIKNILEKNGGYIEVESTPGQGTTFYCYLREYGE